MPHSPGLCRAEAQPKGNHVCIHACIHRLNYISSSLWDLRGLELEKENLCFSKTVCVCFCFTWARHQVAETEQLKGGKVRSGHGLKESCMKGWCGSRTPRRLVT